MRFFNNPLEKEIRQAVQLLSIGTFLEYFDLHLYAHMAILLNTLFFPPTDTHAQNLLSALASCSPFIFRPLGALLFGYIGDKYGRKLTILITTLMMALTCLIMAHIPTYAQIGITAAWIVTGCRILQGMSSMGEIIGAQLFLTEATTLPNRFQVVELVGFFADLGGIVALLVAALCIGYDVNWRTAFWIGACIALIGSIARRKLREAPAYADARQRIKKIAERAGESLAGLKKSAFYTEKVDPKMTLSYFLIKCSPPAFFYLTYLYLPYAFKDVLHYNAHQILIHNSLVGLVELARTVLRIYLCGKINPLRIIDFTWKVMVPFTLALPFLLNHITAAWQLLLIQAFMITFTPTDAPATPIFFRSFPMYRRFSYTSILFALAGALMYAITSYGMSYLIAYFGYGGLLFLLVPVLIGYSYGLHYFKKLEKAAGRYPRLEIWKYLKDGGTVFYHI
jgi:MHS family proline/betaine transporter-like MFS transporter